MGASSTLGLILQIDADESRAGRALAQFERTSGGTFSRVAGHPDKFNTALLSSRETVRLLSEELELHLPRAVSGAIAEMLPGINAIGPALLGAFAIAEIPKFIKEVKEAAGELGGYTAEVRKAEKADIEASNAALIHFTTIAQGNILIAETNRELASLASRQGNWKEQAKAAGEAMGNLKGASTALLGPVGTLINLYRGLKAAEEEGSTAENKAADLRQRLAAQLEQMTKLQEERQKALAKATKEAQAAQEKADKEAAARAARLGAAEAHAAMQRIHVMQEAGKEVAALAKQEENRAQVEQTLLRARVQFLTTEFSILSVDALQRQNLVALIPQIDAVAQRTVHLSASRKELILATQAARAAEEQWTQAVRDDIAAVEADYAASVKGFASGLAGLIGGRKAQAAVEVIWESARGIACLAEGTWPPNPAAIIAAGMHFEAATQFALLSGGGHGRHGGGAAGGGASGWGSSTGRESAAVERAGGGAPSGGGPGGPGGGQTIIQIQGNLSANGQQQLAAWMGIGSAIGLYKFSASGCTSVPVPLH